MQYFIEKRRYFHLDNSWIELGQKKRKKQEHQLDMEGKLRTVDHVKTVLDLLLSQQLLIHVSLFRGNRGALIKRANEHVQYLF